MKLVTQSFRVNSAQEFIESFTSTNDGVYYVFCARSQPYSGSFTDSDIPSLYDNNNDLLYDAYDDMLHGKRLSANDVSLMIRRHDWERNVVYTRYDNQANNLFDTKFYVVNSNNAVFKCLNNNNGANSTSEPAVEDPLDEFYFTSDGYHWKYMYTANTEVVKKFATKDYFPFVENVNVTANAVAGTVDVIDVVSAGNRRYVATNSGTIRDVIVEGNDLVYQIDSSASGVDDHYNDSVIYLTSGPGAGQQRKIVDYINGLRHIVIDEPFDTPPETGVTQYTIAPNVLITGDGVGGQAYAVVNTSTGTLMSVVVTNRGADYSYVNATVQGKSTGSSGEAAPVLRAIKPPPGGHGFHQNSELGAHWVSISTTLSSSASGGKIIGENDFRVVGVLKDPKLRRVYLGLDESDVASDFDIAERVTQANTNATGIIADIYTGNNTLAISQVSGLFNTVDIITGNSTSSNAQIDLINGQSEYFDQTLRLICENADNAVYFQEDEPVFQPGREGEFSANGLFYSSSNASSTTATSNGDTVSIRLTHTRGTFNSSDDLGTEWFIQGNNIATPARAKIEGQVLPDLLYGTGEVLYIENMQPISKDSRQTETFKFIFEF